MNDTPASLLQRLCASPQDTDWRRFVHLFTPLLSSWAKRFGVPQADLEDALQDVFTLLFEKLPAFQLDASGSFRAWLWTVFRRQVLARRKKAGRQPTANDEQLERLATADAVPEAAESEFRRRLVERALQLVRRDFPDQTWRLFRRLAIDGVPGVAVATEFGVSANAVYLARGRVMARLRAELAGLNG